MAIGTSETASAAGARPKWFEAIHRSRDATGWAGALAIVVVCLGPTVGRPGDAVAASAAGNGKFCSATAKMLFDACLKEAESEFLVAGAKCINVSDNSERAQCLDEARGGRPEADQLCRQQLIGRRNACKLLGEGRYDPDVDPSRFDDAKHPTHPNPYFPLGVGNRWTYQSTTETDVVEIVDETKRIAGVDCIVARDLVSVDGFVIEATDDWYANAKDGSTWYFGEEAKDYETFDGDQPRRPELVSIEGSFKAGREGDKPGVIFLASPATGDVYQEEFSLTNAEDVTEILSTTYSFGTSAELDQLVPRQLAERFCHGDCVVTKNYSLLEPGAFARKYYARGIGVFLEVEVDTQEVSQLVECNFDSRCIGLPSP